MVRDDVKRLLLVRHAATSATRAAAFPADEPIEDGAAAGAALVSGLVVRGADPVVMSSPALRCRQTAAAAGLDPVIDDRLSESDFGAWAGWSLASVHADDPEAVGAWMTDPAAAPHGGESLLAFMARVAGWLEEQAASLDGTTLAITHGGVVKAAVVSALGAPVEAFWRVDVAPLTVTELHAHDGRWTVTRVNCPVEGAGGHPSAFGGRAAARDEAGPTAAWESGGVDDGGLEGAAVTGEGGQAR